MAAATNTTSHINSKSPTIRRILREAAEISGSPSADFTAEPLDSDLFEWHFTLRGPPKSVYSDGLYHGRIVLPPTYPLRPPMFRFTTPNGRFEANREICLSISGHHEETWQPAWGIRTAIVALRSFMETDARGQLGGMDTTDDMRRRFAEDSRAFKCSTCGRSNLDIILEAEKNAKEISSATEVQIPAELRMGWRNEADAVKEAPARGEIDVTKADDSNADTETAELAEGFVQTSSSIRPAHEDAPGPLRHVSENTTSIASGIRQRDGTALGLTVQSENTVNNTRPATTQPPSDGIPLWIDRAIVALVICLAAMLFKVLFGL